MQGISDDLLRTYLLYTSDCPVPVLIFVVLADVMQISSASSLRRTVRRTENAFMQEDYSFSDRSTSILIQRGRRQ